MEQEVIVEQKECGTRGFCCQMRGSVRCINGIAANKDVDFLFKKGEIHAIMGENGAGKSADEILFGRTAYQR